MQYIAAKYAHGFHVFCFIMILSSVDSYDAFRLFYPYSFGLLHWPLGNYGIEILRLWVNQIILNHRDMQQNVNDLGFSMKQLRPKRDITSLLMHWSYVFLELTHWYDLIRSQWF